MILYREETVRTPIHVPVQYPAYFQGCVYSSHYVAIFSNTVAVQVCVAAQNVQLQQGTPAEAFRFPPFEDYEPVEEKAFGEALQCVQEHIGRLLKNSCDVHPSGQEPLMRDSKEKSVGQKPATPRQENRPDLDKLRGKVLGKDKHEKVVKSLERANFPNAE